MHRSLSPRGMYMQPLILQVATRGGKLRLYAEKNMLKLQGIADICVDYVPVISNEIKVEKNSFSGKRVYTA